jgi:C-terminal processing protease CtpA/Prc
LFYDENYAGAGLRVAEVMTKGPFDNADSKVGPGVIIEKINGVTIDATANYITHFNRIKDKNTLLHLYNPANGQRWEEVIKPISMGTEYGLLYNRWVDLMREKVEEMSDGRLGYVHVRGMNNGSYRTVVEEVLGRNYEKEALIVDTRFNGGGWLHEDLATFLSGEKYIQFAPREKRLGYEPQFKWSKPTVVLVGESNYSDAHMFPFAYRSKKIGQIIGMPVPGTGTAVWWERQIDPTLVFGIPQVGMLSMDGDYLENNQLEPDIKLANAPEQIISGVDQQLTKAVEVLLKEQDQYKVDLEKN